MGTIKDTMNDKLLRAFIALWFLLEWGLAGCGGHIEFGTPVIHPAPCPIQELLLEESDLPDDTWQEIGSPSEKDAPVRMGIEKIGTMISGPLDFTLQQVYRFESDRRAKRAYRDEIESWFTPSEHETKYMIPTEMSNLDVNADQYRVGCYDLKSGGSEQCQYVAQKGPYIIRFIAGMRALTYEDFLVLINDLDQRAISCLGQ